MNNVYICLSAVSISLSGLFSLPKFLPLARRPKFIDALYVPHNSSSVWAVPRGCGNEEAPRAAFDVCTETMEDFGCVRYALRPSLPSVYLYLFLSPSLPLSSYLSASLHLGSNCRKRCTDSGLRCSCCAKLPAEAEGTTLALAFLTILSLCGSPYRRRVTYKLNLRQKQLHQ